MVIIYAEDDSCNESILNNIYNFPWTVSLFLHYDAVKEVLSCIRTFSLNWFCFLNDRSKGRVDLFTVQYHNKCIKYFEYFKSTVYLKKLTQRVGAVRLSACFPKRNSEFINRYLARVYIITWSWMTLYSEKKFILKNNWNMPRVVQRKIRDSCQIKLAANYTTKKYISAELVAF